MFKTFILILSLANIHSHAASNSSVLTELPKKFIQVEKTKQGYAYVVGKCCKSEVYRNFINNSGEWEIEGNMGFETQASKVLKAEKKNGIYLIQLVNGSLEIQPLKGQAHFYRVNKDPFFQNSSESVWVDDAFKARAQKIVENDCPADGEAC